MKKLFLLIISGFLSLSFSQAQSVIYVDSANIMGTHNGNSWATAYNKLQPAINAAQSGDSIFVAKGTYQPQANISFTLKSGVDIFGGFDTTEAKTFAARNWRSYKTKLKGNNNIIFNSNSSIFVGLVDGFYITDGVGSNYGGVIDNKGTLTFKNIVFRNNKVTGRYGGAIQNGNTLNFI